MKKSGKIIAFVLTFTLLLTFQPLTEAIKAVADVVASNKTKSDGDITSDIYGDVDGTVLTKTLEEAFEEGYQKRLKEEEERLNEIILEKENGNRKLIYYFEPVKYFDEDGNVKDKSYDISRLPNGSLQTAASDIITTFPDKFSDGISLKNRDVSLTLSPLNAYPSNAALSSDKKTVTYEIDSHTRYDYSLTLMGFKEDIVVEEYTGQTEYSFVLETGGLSLVFENNVYVLKDGSDIKATLGDIILFTADEQNNAMGELKTSVIAKDSKYLIKVCVDDEWLRDEKTAYPITIDPSINITVDNTAYGKEVKVKGTTVTGCAIGLPDTLAEALLQILFPPGLSMNTRTTSR